MRSFKFVTTLFFFMIFCLLSSPAHAVVVVGPPAQNEARQADDLTKADLEQMLGRKLTFTEKIGWKLGKKAIKKRLAAQEEDLERKADTAFTLSLIGIIGYLSGGLLSLVSLPFIGILAFLAIIPAIIGVKFAKDVKRRGGSYISDRAYQRASLAKILGWITIGAAALSIILALAIVLFFFLISMI
ncbi:MAG: hypothetical protein IPL49_16665 [Saprospirales bacterium]|nr:hypothetical protein [Saprospirales bacterium]